MQIATKAMPARTRGGNSCSEENETAEQDGASGSPRGAAALSAACLASIVQNQIQKLPNHRQKPS